MSQLCNLSSKFILKPNSHFCLAEVSKEAKEDLTLQTRLDEVQIEKSRFFLSDEIVLRPGSRALVGCAELFDLEILDLTHEDCLANIWRSLISLQCSHLLIDWKSCVLKGYAGFMRL